MKGLKLSLIVLVAALLTFGLSGMGYAYHSGGVANCDGCHSMHAPHSGSSYLLQGTDESSTCLNCHATSSTTPSSYHIMTYPNPGTGVPPHQMTPGGDFGWLLETYTYSLHGTTTTEQGMTHGHNPVAYDYGILQDTILTTAPGTTIGFSSSNMACTSCHDPHGKYRRIGGDTPGSYTIGTTGAPIIGSGSYNNSLTPTAGQAVGSYRLLAGIGYTTQNGALSIPYPGIPVAVAPSTYNSTETLSTNQVRVAYGYSTDGAGLTSWGEWCGTCHGNFHSTSTGSSGMLTHPTDVALNSGPEYTNYGLYVSSGIMTGSPSTSYLSLVPFIQNSNDYSNAPTTGLKATASGGTGTASSPATPTILTGPGSTDQVSCMSCHRAHASGWQYNLRWNMTNEFITYAASGVPVWPGTDNAGTSYANGRLSTETMAAYYNRPATLFGAYQRVLCNKCHAQD
jgi:hypothetical protein